jgi:hypothetical protein
MFRSMDHSCYPQQLIYLISYIVLYFNLYLNNVIYGANSLFYTVNRRQPRLSLVGEDNQNPTYRIYMANQKSLIF